MTWLTLKSVAARHPCRPQRRLGVQSRPAAGPQPRLPVLCLPGDGSIDWGLVQAGFPRTTYTGALMREVVPQDGGAMTPEEFARLAYGRALELRGRLGHSSPETTPTG